MYEILKHTILVFGKHRHTRKHTTKLVYVKEKICLKPPHLQIVVVPREVGVDIVLLEQWLQLFNQALGRTMLGDGPHRKMTGHDHVCIPWQSRTMGNASLQHHSKLPFSAFARTTYRVTSYPVTPWLQVKAQI